MVSKNFLLAPLSCLLLLTGAAKSGNGLRIHFRGDWPLDGGKFQFRWLSVGRLGRTTGVLRGKRDWETKRFIGFVCRRAAAGGGECSILSFARAELAFGGFDIVLPRKMGSG